MGIFHTSTHPHKRTEPRKKPLLYLGSTIPIYLGSIIPYIFQPTKVFFIAQLVSSTHPHKPNRTWTPGHHENNTRALTGRPANEIVLPRPPPRILSHRIHGTGIFTCMKGWFVVVNVGKYTIHGSYGFVDPQNKGTGNPFKTTEMGGWHASKVDMTPIPTMKHTVSLEDDAFSFGKMAVWPILRRRLLLALGL